MLNQALLCSDLFILISHFIFSFSMKEYDKVIEFSEGSRQMEVTYNPHLTRICEETQQLLVMGYEVPGIVTELVSKAKRFSKQARELDQIATFHNTIGDRMIPSQRPMMLDTAVALSKLVAEQHDVVWSNSEQVQKYVELLKSKVTELAKHNGYLSSLHISICKKVLRHI
jgi:dynein heavy chain 2